MECHEISKVSKSQFFIFYLISITVNNSSDYEFHFISLTFLFKTSKKSDLLKSLIFFFKKNFYTIKRPKKNKNVGKFKV